jgi:hypothetical protein
MLRRLRALQERWLRESGVFWLLLFCSELRILGLTPMGTRVQEFDFARVMAERSFVFWLLLFFAELTRLCLPSVVAKIPQ